MSSYVTNQQGEGELIGWFGKAYAHRIAMNGH